MVDDLCEQQHSDEATARDGSEGDSVSLQADDRKSGSSSEDANDQPANDLCGRLCNQKAEEAGSLTVRQLQIVENESGPAGGEISFLQLSLGDNSREAIKSSRRCNREPKCLRLVVGVQKPSWR